MTTDTSLHHPIGYSKISRVGSMERRNIGIATVEETNQRELGFPHANTHTIVQDGQDHRAITT